MYRGVVVGCVVSTVKEEGLENVPLLLVRRTKNGREEVIVAADCTRQAGRGDHVYLMTSSEASLVFHRLVPTDASIVGFIDSYHVELTPENSNPPLCAAGH